MVALLFESFSSGIRFGSKVHYLHTPTHSPLVLNQLAKPACSHKFQKVHTVQGLMQEPPSNSTLNFIHAKQTSIGHCW